MIANDTAGEGRGGSAAAIGGPRRARLPDRTGARLYLHAGGFKTGSTAIQAYLARHAAALAQQGLLVPNTGMEQSGRHLPLVKALTGGEPSRQAKAMLSAFASELAQVPEMDALISCERLETHLEEALPFFRSLGRDLIVILYVRNQPQRINSRYVQQARLLRDHGRALDYAEAAMSDPDNHYVRWLDRAELSAQTMIFRPYTGPIRDDVIADLLTTLGVPREGMSQPREVRANGSIGPVGVAALRMVIRLVRSRGLDPPRAIRKRIVTAVEEADARLALPAFQGLDDVAFRRITEHHAADNRRFAQTVWGCAWEDVFARDLNSPSACNEIDLDGDRTAELREARRIFRSVRPLLRGGAPAHSAETLGID